MTVISKEEIIDNESDLKVKMHPIIIMNISDHLTRVSSQNKKITNVSITLYLIY